MATSPMNTVIQHLRKTLRPQDQAGLTDAHLLKHFIEHRDEASFATLIHRHGPMVMGVCLRVARNHQDAEDAFQATFLVLVRKAASIATRELLANWLYGVAHNTALKAKAATVKRQLREKQVKEMPEPAVAEQESWSDDLKALLDQELSRLPDKYRVPIVLCDLEGKTRKEAAKQLGCPEGSVSSRLSRARIMLAKRLARYGLAVSGGSLAVVLSHKAASACVPTSVVSSTIKAATLFAAGQLVKTGVVSAKVAALTEGMLKSMLLSKLKTMMVVLMVLGMVAFGGGLLTHHMAAAQQGETEKSSAKGKAREADAAKEPAVKTEAALNSAIKLSETRAAQKAEKTEKSKQAPAYVAQKIDEMIPELRNIDGLLSTNLISRVKQPTTFCTGFRFRFPYGPPGAAITYSVDKPENHHVWPPRVDASTPEGRKAIYQSLRDAHKGGHFTMDGNELLVFGGARIVPFGFKDERVRKAWFDLFRRVPRARFAEFVKRQHAAARVTAGPIDGSYALPLAQSSFFAGLTSDDQVVILWVQQAPEESRYDVGHYLLEPAAPAP